MANRKDLIDFILTNIGNELNSKLDVTDISFPSAINFRMDFTLILQKKTMTSKDPVQRTHLLEETFSLSNISIEPQIINSDIITENMALAEFEKLKSYVGKYYRNHYGTIYYVKDVAPTGHLIYLWITNDYLRVGVMKTMVDDWQMVLVEEVKKEKRMPVRIKNLELVNGTIDGMEYWKKFSVEEMVGKCVIFVDPNDTSIFLDPVKILSVTDGVVQYRTQVVRHNKIIHKDLECILVPEFFIFAND